MFLNIENLHFLFEFLTAKKKEKLISGFDTLKLPGKFKEGKTTYIKAVQNSDRGF